MTPATISLTTSFFIEAGLVTKNDAGRFTPTQATIEFARAYEWDKEKAPQRLATAVRDTWFARELEKHLSVTGNMLEKDAIAVLAEKAAASRDYAANLGLLLDYLDAANLIMRDGSNIRRVRAEGGEPGARPPSSEPESTVRRAPPPHSQWLVRRLAGGSPST